MPNGSSVDPSTQKRCSIYHEFHLVVTLAMFPLFRCPIYGPNRFLLKIICIDNS